MKTTLIKSLLATAAFVAVSTSSAAIITVPTDGSTVTMGATLTGSVTWTFSEALLNTLDFILEAPYGSSGTISSYDPASVTTEKDPLGIWGDTGRTYLAASMSAPLTSLKIDQQMGLLRSASSVGGITIAVDKRRSLSSGGSLTVSNLDIDFVDKRIYANLIGANGVGSLNHFYLWNFSSESSHVEPTIFQSELGGLKMTAEGLSVLTQSLGLYRAGLEAFPYINYYDGYGSITTTIVATPAVPEPATLAYLMGGLAIVGMSLRRRAK